jgi:hypothetical protein
MESGKKSKAIAVKPKPRKAIGIADLTDKQEEFCQLIADGHSQTHAYKIAFDAHEWKRVNLCSSASFLASNNPNVAARILALREELARITIWTRATSARELIDIVKDGGVLAKDKTAAVKELNQMHGYNQPTKIEISGKDGGAIETVVWQVID